MTEKQQPKTKSRRKKGRPTRAEASKKALANVDLTSVNPRQVLLQIAADRSSPATARVAACRALLGETADGRPPAAPGPDDQVTALALKILQRR